MIYNIWMRPRGGSWIATNYSVEAVDAAEAQRKLLAAVAMTRRGCTEVRAVLWNETPDREETDGT